MKILHILSEVGKFFETAGGQIASNMHFWRYEPDMQHISITNKCRQQIKDLGLSESYAFDVYNNGIKTSGDNRMIKKYHGYQVSILYMIAPDTGRVVITWIGKKEIW